MLVLSVLTDDVVHVGENIEVMVVRVHPDGKVQLGFRAPREIPIIRDKLKKRTLVEESALEEMSRALARGEQI